MELTTRNIDDVIEPVGGVWGVSTLPSHARKGVSTALMNEVHRHFCEKGYRFSFLTTRRTFVAYSLYLKLGYEDAVEFPSAYKFLHRKKAPRKKRRGVKTDWRKILDIYDRFTAEKTGFVVRDAGYFRMQQKRASIDFECNEEVMVGAEGYAFFGGAGPSLHVDELVPSDDNKGDGLIREIESRAQDLVYDRVVLSDRMLAAYKVRGYMTHDRSHGLLMAKPLTNGITFEEAYGNQFYTSVLDLF